MATGYAKRVQAVVRKIPRGKVATYGQVAQIAGFPRTARMVARALQHAPPDLPWFRVLGAGGRIRLPGTSGLEQRLRLESEGVEFSGQKIKKTRYFWKKA
ncbi:MAG: MGMT family protein [Bryobacteraceae bacterium]